MEPTVPTIETLRGKTKGELRAMFRKAVEGAVAQTGPQVVATRKTIDILRRCLTLKP